jgi:hypothetical protein
LHSASKTPHTRSVKNLVQYFIEMQYIVSIVFPYQVDPRIVNTTCEDKQRRPIPSVDQRWYQMPSVRAIL